MFSNKNPIRLLAATLFVLSSLFISTLPLFGAAVDRSLMGQRPDNNSCTLLVNVAPRAAVRMKAMGGAIESVDALTGVSSIDSLKAVGVSVSTIIPQWLLDSFLPHVRAQALADMNGGFKLTVPRSCGEPIVSTYKTLLSNDPQVTSVRNEGFVQIAVETILPAKRPAPKDPDFVNQYMLNCTGQTINVGERNFTCREESDIRFLIGSLPQERFGGDVYLFSVDSGIELAHPDNPLEQIDARFSVNIIAKNETEKKDIQDRLGHGQHIFGIHSAIGNNGKFGTGVTGVSGGKIKHVIVRIFGENGYGTTSTVIAAQYWIVNTVETLRQEKANFVTLSTNSWVDFGGDGDIPELRKAVLAHLNAGVTFVGAAGNASSNNDKEKKLFPPGWADQPEFLTAKAPLIMVGATDWNNQIASFSSYGWQTTSVFVPGVAIYSTSSFGGFFGFPDGYIYLSGTSMATPGAAGVIALLFKSEGPAAIQNLRDRITASTDKARQFVGKAAGGRLNVHDFLTLDKVPPEPVTDAKFLTVNHSSAEIRFTIPRDFSSNGEERELGGIQVRTSNEPITPDNFYSARPHFAPWPLGAGQAQRILIDDLRPKKTYFTVVKLIDKGGNSTLVNLPPFTTNPAQITWVESVGGFSQNEWTLKNTGNYTGPKMWHFEDGLLVYRRPGQNNYDTSDLGFPTNEGVALSPWQEIPKDALLVLNSSRNTGIFEVYADQSRWVGDDLIVFAQFSDGKEQEVKRLQGTFDYGVEDRIPLTVLAGKKVRIGFKFHASEETGKLNYHKNFKGIAIRYVEIYGTRQDVTSLPRVVNGTFDFAAPSRFKNAPNWAFDLKNWQVDYICYPGCLAATKKPDKNNEWSEDWYVSRLNDEEAMRTVAHPPLNPPHKPHDPPPYVSGIMRMWNNTRDKGAILAVTSDVLSVKAGDLYQVNFRAKLSANLTVLVFSVDKANKPTVVGYAEIKDTGASWKWTNYAVPFAGVSGATNVQIAFLVDGRAVTAAADIDDVSLGFLEKTFPENP